MEYVMRPIGIIHSPFSDPSQTPIQAARSQERGTVEIFPEYSGGLQDLEGFSHIHLLYVFHESIDFSLRVEPFLDDQEHGLFSTRYPARPNPIGLSVVRLLGVKGSTLEIEGVDMLDGTPLLDIKPFIPEFDQRTVTKKGWYSDRSRQ